MANNLDQLLAIDVLPSVEAELVLVSINLLAVSQ